MMRIYISHSRHESRKVRHIAKALKSRGYDVWIDYGKTGSASHWQREFQQAVKNADVFFVFLSSAALHSENVSREVLAALESRKMIIPILLEGPGELASRRVLGLPNNLQYIDMRYAVSTGISQLLSRLDRIERGEDAETESTPFPPTLEPSGFLQPATRNRWAKRDGCVSGGGGGGDGGGGDDGGGGGGGGGDGGDGGRQSEVEKRARGQKAEKAKQKKERKERKEEEQKEGKEKEEKEAKEKRRKEKEEGEEEERSVKEKSQPVLSKRVESLRPHRYANVVPLQSTGNSLLSKSAPIKSGSLFRIRLDIGPLAPLSVVEFPEPIPEKLLPPGIWLDVMLSSTDFQVGRSKKELGRASVAEGRFYLPPDGSPALTEAKETYLYFMLRAPQRNGPARARIGYYYRNHLVQSQLLVAKVGRVPSRFRVTTDYTLSRSLTGLDRLPQRRQLSILTNDNGNGSHEFIIRAENEKGNLLARPLAFQLKTEAIGAAIQHLRVVMRREPVAPTQRRRTKAQLKADLKALAPLGRDLYSAVLGQYCQELYPLIRRENLVMQVTRPTSSSFTFPWGLIYDIPLDSNKDWKYCSLVEDWDDRSALIAADVQECPKAKRHDPNTLCPFGFWGNRYHIEQLSRSDKPALEICPPPKFEMVVAETQCDVVERDLKAHVAAVRKLLERAFPNAALREGNSVDSIKELLSHETPIIYFYCHGERPRPNSPDTCLGVGRHQSITSGDFIGWVQHWWEVENKKVWDMEKVRPLILINACHSVDISPDSLVSYLDAFIGTGHAAGVIGTEVRVAQNLAMEAALEFFASFLKGDSVGQAMHKLRMSFLRSGNLFGLVYTPYCWSDLKITHG